MKKITSKKLILNKNIISTLNEEQMSTIIAGAGFLSILGTCPGTIRITCLTICKTHQTVECAQ